MRIQAIAVCCLAATAGAQSVATRVTTQRDRDLMMRLVALEDLRQPLSDIDDDRLTGIGAANPYLRAFTVRGIGRLEQYDVGRIVPVLSDTDAEVRAAAADALAQSVARPIGASDPAKANHTRMVDSARATLLGRLAVEKEPTVIATLLESIGRLAQGSVGQVRATSAAIEPHLSASSVIERRGAIRGLFFLARKREARAVGAIPVEVTDKLYSLLAQSDLTPTDRFNIAFALWGAAAMPDDRIATMVHDRDPYVRERSVVAVSRSANVGFIRSTLADAMKDPAPIVRFRALNVYAQKLRATDGCAPLVALTRDADTTVALGATDALSGCHDETTVARLVSMASSYRGQEAWHLPTHAYVALAVADSTKARQLASRFISARNFFVRMYADTAARLMGDVKTLYLLAHDPHPNVATSAIAALSALVGHAADFVYVAALAAYDNQLITTAATALKGSAWPGLSPIVRARYEKIQGIETFDDARGALLQRMREVGDTVGLPQSPVRKLVEPSFDDLVALEKATARIEMADGSVITMKLYPFDAPTNAYRFSRLAKAGVFDGLTFHRVAPFFVVQGPSPNANEYSAPDSVFERDELGVSNTRGTVGLSTGSRDTADGQIYINTVDNIWLDHEYTVMGMITAGLEAFDRMQEGARIRRITILP